MNKLILAASLVAVVALAGCAGPVAPSSSPSAPAEVPSAPPAAPSETPASPASPEPSVSPEPTIAPPAARPSATPRPAKPALNASEKYLKAGIRRGAVDCEPVRDSLPVGSIAGIECGSDDRAVARVGFYLFGNDRDMLDAYLARMKLEGIKIESGGCNDKEGEGAYVPWGPEELAPYRNGCFINDAGYANLRVTLPAEHVYIGVLGRTRDMDALVQFAFLGNHDTPSFPTLWAVPG
jgi:hypothetical protein